MKSLCKRFQLKANRFKDYFQEYVCQNMLKYSQLQSGWTSSSQFLLHRRLLHYKMLLSNLPLNKTSWRLYFLLTSISMYFLFFGENWYGDEKNMHFWLLHCCTSALMLAEHWQSTSTVRILSVEVSWKKHQSWSMDDRRLFLDNPELGCGGGTVHERQH